MQVEPFGVFCQLLPESRKIRVIGLKDLYFIADIIICAVIIMKRGGPVIPGDPVKAPPAGFRADIKIEFPLHRPEGTNCNLSPFYLYYVSSTRFFSKALNFFHMALIPNNKKKKDGKPAGPKSNIPGFPAPKGSKSNTKGVVKNTRLTGGSQRGS